MKKYYKILTKNFLRQEYIINKKSIRQIVKGIGYSIITIYRNLKQYKIKIRTRQNACLKGKYHPNFKDGRYSKKYYCIDCSKKISVNSGFYGQGRCLSCAMKKLMQNPKNNPNYIEDLIREYPFKFNKILKESIRERDNYQCQICGKTTKKNGRKLDVHHMDYDKNNLNPENLISLCHSCHMQSSGNREIYIEYFKILRSIIYD